MDFDLGSIQRSVGGWVKWVPYSSDWLIFPFGIITNLILPLVIGALGIGYLLNFMLSKAPGLRRIPGLGWIIAVGIAFAGAANPVIRPFLVFGGALAIAYFKFGKMPNKFIWIGIAIIFLILLVVLYWFVIPFLENITRGIF